METKKIILLVAGLFLVNLISAVPNLGSIPPLPDNFYGNVLIDGENASVGTEIEVYISSVLRETYILANKGTYDLHIKTGELGNSIEFKISGKIAGSSTRQGGEKINLNLSITNAVAAPVPTPSPSSSGGGSSGGGGGSPGRTIIIPPTTTSNNSNEDNLDSTKSSDSSSGNSEINLEETEQSSTFFRMTGAVTGFAKTKKGIATIFVLIIVVFGIGVMLIKFNPKKWKKEF